MPVAVTCQVLKITKQGYYQWANSGVSQRDWDDAHLANAAFDVHADDPEFGYRLIADELEHEGFNASERRIWRVCRVNGIRSVIASKSKRKGSWGPPTATDKVRRDFTADAANQLWLTDITEHWTSEGKLYLCAVKDVFSNRIVGYSIDSRMKASLAVSALTDAINRRRPAPGLVVHSDRGSQGGFNWSSQHPEYGGVQDWRGRTGSRRRSMCPRECGGNGARIGHYGRRCVRQGGPSRRGRCSGSSGG